MYRPLQAALADLVKLAAAGNTHAVPTLHQMLDVYTDARDRQQIRNAIQKAERKPRSVPTISPEVFEMDPETSRLWAIVSAAPRN